ncbi:MAG: bifunctional glutamate N-acetyltransferase/amino-acid acetyltransferase ArgJ [Meiothermus sp.]|uniref:bifunctional glutamate N-acetyltransferase/amino-acid acetyltransferase ArgJ n=1 Tax=Meiothermus sp. TaxID=1955249 RepID=UPI0025E2953E|nr:bifunctional glutamate N-acetyltransferase/amino-acid acetyltransferase ArgJ [Meiothermus sp.]MCS7068352.1 bifunctional glutamate N-acetyltransferase/amino-acid acetyltransferase ArgJ [Meiothermus sp.]MCX7600741.1 bifunctional glutamate N-acetyltransferase/amino-acid acetyltransferase ArgJ [Meiothermus sp.]MDW8426736.1 bifunctional glutamate N-acetyltransferase/amino-acid acetyltransferase ArgJ [Meiothermus sp.]
MQLPIGFRAGATQAGIKPSGKPDLALLVSGTPCHWAFVGTLNKAAAPCVLRGRELLAKGQPLQAIVVNAGNANCATGPQGFWADRRMAELAATQQHLAPEAVLTGSTGVIGQPLPVEKVEAGLPNIRLGLEVDPFMEAIMTTDLVPKMAEATLSSGARVVGVCKGSGMIAPNMATMLAYIVSDAEVSQEELRRGWQGVVDRSFNQVTVDTDTSTNDMAVLMTNGAAGPVDLGEFWQAVEQVCVELARKLARDGEGATKLLTVKVTGAASDAEARKAALSVAASPLWKSAVYGNDPNWGRVMMALGKAGVALEPDRVCITLQGIPLYAGQVLDFDRARASQAMQAEEVQVEADLGLGPGQGMAWGCDLTEGYVRINALYTT